MEKMMHRRPAKRDVGKAAITIMAGLELVAWAVIEFLVAVPNLERP
jgi:hypothetical protein